MKNPKTAGELISQQFVHHVINSHVFKYGYRGHSNRDYREQQVWRKFLDRHDLLFQRWETANKANELLPIHQVELVEEFTKLLAEQWASALEHPIHFRQDRQQVGGKIAERSRMYVSRSGLCFIHASKVGRARLATAYFPNGFESFVRNKEFVDLTGKDFWEAGAEGVIQKRAKRVSLEQGTGYAHPSSHIDDLNDHKYGRAFVCWNAEFVEKPHWGFTKTEMIGGVAEILFTGLPSPPWFDEKNRRSQNSKAVSK